MGLLVFAGAIGFQSEAVGHPAHAKPVNYPFVVGFERFHSSLDDEDYLAEGGFILLNELNCVACHQPPENLKERLPGIEATNLDGVGSRLDYLDLEIMIRNPRFVKKDTTMPSVFAGPDRDLEEVEALKHYLATLRYEVPEYPRGDVEVGRQFYHQIGCVGCHAPEAGFRPAGVPENAEIELAGLPSVPMNLADLYDLNSLTHFLLNSNDHRPSGRMPEFDLSIDEASNLAAYLKAGPDLFLPENLTEALTASDQIDLDEKLAERGRQLFDQKNCSACHLVPGEKVERLRFRATPLADLDYSSEAACFSKRPVSGGIPFYGLDEVQKRAIGAALQRLGDQGKVAVAELIDWRMKQLNCYACHEREGVGGVETAREVYFGFATEDAVKLGRWGHLPPPLDRVGAKLTDDWMKLVMLGEGGKGEVRPYMSARMPAYRHEDALPLTKHFSAADSIKKSLRLPIGPGGRKAGAELFSVDGKNCVQCHSFGPLKETGMPGINLSLSGDRLKFGYFQQLLMDPHSLQPGTVMPDSFEDNKADKAAVQALWQFIGGKGVGN